jgi:NADH-quinone oxidoreductase subunit A
LWGWFAFAEMTIFVGILILGLAYAWAKGYLDWVKPKEKLPEIESKVPASMYQAINQKYAERPVNLKDSESNDTRES